MVSLMAGLLYVVGTPIGNLKDITYRAVEVLAVVDFVVGENLERTLKLLNHLGIKKPVIPIHSQNEGRKARSIVERLGKGEDGALITGAGTPCISDPGTMVVKEALEAGFQVAAVPGPSAAASAISISGVFADRFLFFGFLPQKRGKRLRTLRELSEIPYALVFYESPRRILETLEAMKEVFQGRPVAILREMTKIHEEIVRGTFEEVVSEVARKEGRGEYTIVVGYPEEHA